MLLHLRPAIVLTILLSVLTGLAYPLAITGIAQAVLSTPADGSLVMRDGTLVGSALIGQNFASDRYFHGRPSATNTPDPKDASKTIDLPYNASNSSGSNLGPTSQKLVDRIRGAIGPLGTPIGQLVPADAVTTSASGLDPDISPAFALLQARRVAESRKLPVDRVEELVRSRIEPPLLRLFGDARVNVLGLNLALDQLKA